MRVSFRKIVLNPLYCLFFIAIFLGQNLYLFDRQLHFIRFVPILLVFVLFYRFRKSRINIAISNPYVVLLLASAFYYAYSVFVSFIHYEYIVFNSFLNFSLAIVLITSIILLFWLDGERALPLFVKVAFIFYLVSMVIAFFEIATGYHLSISAANIDDRIKFTPSVFFVNTNDFCAIHLLTYIFLVVFFYLTKNKFHIKFLYVLYVLYVISFLIYYFANARLSMLVMVFVLMYYFRPSILKIMALIGLFVSVLFMINPDYFLPLFEKLIAQMDFQTTSSDVSTIRRINLYKFGLLSIFNSYGFGFGIDASSQYYQLLNEPSLDGLINPHGYLIELLINGGVIVVIGYLFLMLYLTKKLCVRFRRRYLIFLIFYNVILFSSSSSLFLWPHYLIFFVVWHLYYRESIFNIELKAK